MRDGRIAYVDFGNVAVLSQLNKEILIDAVVHAINKTTLSWPMILLGLVFLRLELMYPPLFQLLKQFGKILLEKVFLTLISEVSQ